MFFSLRSGKFVTPLLGNLRCFGVFFYPNLVVHLTSLIHIFTEFGP